MAAVVTYCKPSPFLGQFPSHLGKFSSKQNADGAFRVSKISALFWGSRQSLETELGLSPMEFPLTGLGSEDASVDPLIPQKISISVVSSITDVSADEWDSCNLDATGPEQFNPFLSHGFLSSLEVSGCSVKETGWTPCHIVARDELDNVLGVVPLYLKSHSYGEFVFDYSWADAYHSFGSKYYPKFQCCVPFTPVTGPRILLRNVYFRDQLFDIMVSALKDLTAKSQVSSLHITFSSKKEWQKLKEKGFLQRIGMQYHWKNRNYKNLHSPESGAHSCVIADIGCFKIALGLCCFDEFLMDIKQSKRKNIRQERKKISAQNLTMKRLRGHEIKATHWDSFYKFYRNTTDNKWGSPYLTKDFFHNMGSKMGDNVLLVIAEEGDELVAGALNLIGGDTLFGRLWGCHPKAYYPSLHFEACYYQAIEAAIELNLSTVEAGAQGEHKIHRGYLPVTTHSCHYFVDETFKKAIQEFLVRESTQGSNSVVLKSAVTHGQVKLVMKLLNDSGPFKEGLINIGD